VDRTPVSRHLYSKLVLLTFCAKDILGRSRYLDSGFIPFSIDGTGQRSTESSCTLQQRPLQPQEADGFSFPNPIFSSKVPFGM